MALEEVGARLSLKDRPKFSEDAKKAASDVKGIGSASKKADDESRGAFSHITKGITEIGKSAAKYGAIAVVGLGVGLVGAIGGAVKAAANLQIITAQTSAVLKSTGGAAGVTSKQIRDLANQISDYSGIEDETVQQGENMLLTFTNIKNAAGKNNDIFTQSTKVLADMSQALGVDMKTQAIQLGKALNDPIMGVSALQRVGVTFTKQQKDQIKTLVESGHTLDAQRLILKELNKEFGGSAKAAGSTFSGSLKRAKNSVEDFLRDLATPLLPVFTKGLGYLASHVLPGVERTVSSLAGKAQKNLFPSLDRVRGVAIAVYQNGFIPMKNVVINDVIPGFQNLWAVVGPLIAQGFSWLRDQLPKVKDAIEGIGVGFRDATSWLSKHKTLTQSLLIIVGTAFGLWKAYTLTIKLWTAAVKIARSAQLAFNTVMDANPVFLVVAAIAALAAGFVYAYKKSETFRRFVQGALHAVKMAAVYVWDWLKKNWPYLLGILTGPFGMAAAIIYKHWDQVKQGATDVKNWIVGVFNDVVNFFTNLPDKMMKLGAGMFDFIKDEFKKSVNFLIKGWNSLHFKLPTFNTHIPGVGKVGGFDIGVPQIPLLHSGGTVREGGTAIIKPDEEAVVLPPSASVVPLPVGTVPGNALGGGNGGPITIQLVVDKKTLATAVYDHTRNKVARQ